MVGIGLKIIFDQRPKLHLGLDAKINQKLLKGIYCISRLLDYFSVAIVAYLLAPIIVHQLWSHGLLYYTQTEKRNIIYPGQE